VAPHAIAHLGFLVPDLEAAVDRWSRALGYTFSPIARYRTETYADASNGHPHFHDARISVSLEDGPMIELMEFTGEGTHAAAQAGFHHVGFVGVEDVEAEIARLRALGVDENGAALIDGDPDRAQLRFTEPADLDGIRFEYVSRHPAPIVGDDGVTLPVGPDGFPQLFAPGAVAGDAPRVHHIALLVDDIDAARERWMAVTGWEWDGINHYRTDLYSDDSDPADHHHDARTSMSANDGVKVELMEFTGTGTHGRAQGIGFHHMAFIDHPSLDAVRAHLADAGVRIEGGAHDDEGRDLLLFSRREDLDGIRLELVDLRLPHPIFDDRGERVIFEVL
jgi:catechol 2,3-dioxygenase-like lactoylglutathione lyase family enzyme